jgi:hypothetical protein
MSPLILTDEQVDELGIYIKADLMVLEQSGFDELVCQCRGKSDFSKNIHGLKHKAAHYLNHLKKRGAHVVLKTAPWSVE